MNLAIDIGNTRIKLAFFAGETLIEKLILDEFIPEEIFNLATNRKVKHIIFSSVAGDLDKEFEKQLRLHFFLLLLNAKTPIPIQNDYKTPSTLGKDRVAALVGAYSLFPNKTCLVIDAGTCITYDILNSEGTFLGGNISPGMKMRLKAMHYFTNQLPLPKIKATKTNWGDSTEGALLNGAQLGTLLEIEGFINLCHSDFGETITFLTGGDAIFFANKIKKKIFVRPNLVLTGLNKILNYNVKHSI